MGLCAQDTPPGGQSTATGSPPESGGPRWRKRGTRGDWSGGEGGREEREGKRGSLGKLSIIPLISIIKILSQLKYNGVIFFVQKDL